MTTRKTASVRLATVGITLAALMAVAHADTVLVQWTFPESGTNTTADGGIDANTNRMLTAVGTSAIGDVAGAGPEGDRAATASGWDDGAEGKYWHTALTTEGYERLTLSSKQRSSNMGPRHFKLQYRLGTNAWADVSGGAIVVADDFTNGVLDALALPPMSANQPLVGVRWLMTENTSVTNGMVGARGTSRIDEIVVRGQLLPGAALPAPRARPAANVGADRFTARWDAVAGATGYELDVAADSAFTEVTGTNYLVNFEGTGETKGSYSNAIVTLSGLDWSLADVLIGTLTNDWKDGARAARLRGHATSMMAMEEDVACGIGAVAFDYRRYSDEAQVDWRVEVSTNAGVDWVQAGMDFTAPDSNAVRTFAAYVGTKGPARMRIKRATETGTADKRLNVDNIRIMGSAYIPGYKARPVPSLSEVVDGLADKQWYYYRVRATNATQVSAYSDMMAVQATAVRPGALLVVR